MSSNMQDFHKEFELAKQLAKEAGEKLLLYFHEGSIEYSLKNDNYKNWLTKADGEIESFLKENLLKNYPTIGFLGEETEPNTKDLSWIVDPIDGTSPFARGIPEFGVVIGLKLNLEMIFSVIYFPVMKDLFSAYKNEGTYKNNKPVHISQTDDIKKAVISLSRRFTEADHPYREYLISLLTTYRTRLGMSSSVEDCYLAEGTIDVSIRINQSIWDVAPECLIMQEAGAIVTDIYGKPLQYVFIKDSKTSYVGVNKNLAEKAKDILYLKS